MPRTTSKGEEFKQGKMDLNYWKNYDNLSRAEYFNQSKIKALVAPVKKVKNGSKKTIRKDSTAIRLFF